MAKNAIAVVEKEALPLLAEANKLTVENAEDMLRATVVLSELNKVNDRMTAEKEKVTKPLMQALKAERDRWKPLETQYEAAIAWLRKAMSVYQTAEKARADEEAAKIAARVGEGKGKLKIETAVRKMEDIEKPEAVVVSEAGMVKWKTVQKFEVTDIMKIAALSDNARKYLLPNEVEIRKAMLAGVEVPGVRYYEEQVPMNYR